MSRRVVVALGLLAAVAALAGPPALGQSSGGQCSDVAIGPDEYVILKSTGEVLLLPRTGEIGIRISPQGVAEQFRLRPAEDRESVRADVELVGGRVLRGYVCTGCIFYPGETIPAGIMFNELHFELDGMTFQVPLYTLMSVTAKGGGQWQLGFRSGETLTGRVKLPPGILGLSVTNEYGLVNLALEKIASITVLKDDRGEP